jgi:glycosyltransferase involved in cell wall biosynthesis
MLKRQLKLQSGRDFDQVNKVAFIGDYLPRKCGIATFTHDLRNAYNEAHPHIKSVVIAINDTKEGYAYSSDVVFEVDEQDEVGYMRAADYINNSGVDVVCLQHEFGIYGGPSGVMILSLLKALRVPIVTTLHTILVDPSIEQRIVMNSVLSISTRIVTMAEKGKEILTRVYQAPPEKLRLIPHGIPEMEFADTEHYKKEVGLSGRKVILTFGLLSPNKGIEYAVRGMAEVVKNCPDALYVYLGQTHPHLIREHGESYRNSLEWIAKDLGIQDNVKFINRFVDLPLLKQYIAACDVYLTPYLHEAQITSGTLSYSFGMGTAVVSTPYWHAAELLADDRGIIVPFRDSDAIGKTVSALLLDDERRMMMKRNAFDFGRTMTWSNTADLYNSVFDDAQQEHVAAPHVMMPAPVETTLPAVKLDHVTRLTDDTGMFQYACAAVPSRHDGYSLNDNARALILLATLKAGGFHWTPELERLASTYSSFVDYAYDRRANKFRTVMAYNRQWQDVPESEDVRARTLWALGCCVRYGMHYSWATDLFRVASKTALDLKYTRSIAYMILAFDAYLERYPQDGERLPMMRTLAYRLKELYDGASTKGDDQSWCWFEDAATYENGILCWAVIAAARRLQDRELMLVGIESLSWLMSTQLSQGNSFAPLGNSTPWVRGQPKPTFDQRPLEAASCILACVEAANVGDTSQDWTELAHIAFNWFVGGNLLGRSLYDPNTGGVSDVLARTGINTNQGAEALLSFQLSLVALKQLKAAGMQTPATPQTFSSTLKKLS